MELKTKLSTTEKHSVFAYLFIGIMTALLALSLTSCENNHNARPKRDFILCGSSDNNWSTSANIYCDSVQMITPKKVYYYIDGHKFTYYCELIKIYSNEN